MALRPRAALGAARGTPLWMVLNLLKCSFVLACSVVNLLTPCNDFRNKRRTRIVTLQGRLYPCRYNYHKTCHSYGSCERILITAILMERKREPSNKILRALHCNPLLLYVVICPPVTVEKIQTLVLISKLIKQHVQSKFNFNN